MRQIVRDKWLDFTSGLEGVVKTMYLDSHAPPLVTIGYGCLIDPMSMALGLPFVHRDNGEAATQVEIANEWRNLKSQPGLAKMHWKYAAAQCKLELTQEGIEWLALQRLSANHAIMLCYLPDLDAWPADAQMAVHSMAWAMGAGFAPPHGSSHGFPNWLRAAKAGDFAGCAASCGMNATNNPGLIPRNKRNVALLAAAATSDDFEALHISW
jgi:GH24 family phage-related lysozyme (muramidase)